MSARKVKHARRTVGISTKAKRAQREFVRAVIGEAMRQEARAEIEARKRRDRRRQRNAILALLALGFLGASLLAAVL